MRVLTFALGVMVLQHNLVVGALAGDPEKIFCDSFESGSYSSWSNVNPTASEALSVAIDDRISGLDPADSMEIFQIQDHEATPPVYVRNPDCWAADLDLTPLSPWNSNKQNRKAGTLVSPRHIIFAAHFSIAVGATIRFVDQNNNLVERVMIDRRKHPDYSNQTGPDLAVGVLDSDVPPSISFVKVLPDNWQSFIPDPDGIAALGLDQEEKASVRDVQGLYPSSTYFLPPSDPAREAFFERIAAGDSGNPALLVLSQELVILTVWGSYGVNGGGGGTSITYFKDDINEMMTELGGGYQLSEVDLSRFPEVLPIREPH